MKARLEARQDDHEQLGQGWVCWKGQIDHEETCIFPRQVVGAKIWKSCVLAASHDETWLEVVSHLFSHDTNMLYKMLKRYRKTLLPLHLRVPFACSLSGKSKAMQCRGQKSFARRILLGRRVEGILFLLWIVGSFWSSSWWFKRFTVFF